MAALLVAAFLFSAEALAQKAVFVVRHAEKESESNEKPTPLSKAGAERAARLAALLKDAGVTAIYATDTVRAQKTGEPLAEVLRLKMKTYDTRDAKGTMTPQLLLDRIRTEDKDGVVLVVGHSNTVPDVVAALGCQETIKIGPDDYGGLFLVVPRSGGPSVLVKLKF